MREDDFCGPPFPACPHPAPDRGTPGAGETREAEIAAGLARVEAAPDGSTWVALWSAYGRHWPADLRYLLDQRPTPPAAGPAAGAEDDDSTSAWLLRLADDLATMDAEDTAARLRALAAALGRVTAADAAYVLGAAVRYQLPRRTYGSGVVAGVLVAVADLLRPSDRAHLAREIDDALTRGEAGQDCDRAEWSRARAALGPGGGDA